MDAASPTSGLSGLSVLWLVLVLALVPTVLWLLKRSGLIAGLPAGRRGTAALRLVDTLALAPGQRLMRVELRRPDGSLHHLVLGQGGGGISLLQSYAVEANADPDTADLGLGDLAPAASGTGLAGNFREALARVRRPQSSSSAAKTDPPDFVPTQPSIQTPERGGPA